MELQVTTALAAGVFLGLLLAAGLLLPRGLNDVVAVFLLGFGLFYGFRPLLFVLGLDVPFPEHLFPAEESAALLTLTLVGLTLYLACTVLGIAAMTHTGARGWAPFFVQREVDIGRALKVTLVITALASALSAYLLARYGGIGGTVHRGRAAVRAPHHGRRRAGDRRRGWAPGGPRHLRPGGGDRRLRRREHGQAGLDRHQLDHVRRGDALVPGLALAAPVPRW